MRAASTGPIGALLVLAPLVLIPYIAMFGLPKFVSVELSQADDSEADLGSEWDSETSGAADSNSDRSSRKSNNRNSLQEFFGASSDKNGDEDASVEMGTDDFSSDEQPGSRSRSRSSGTGMPPKAVAAASSRKRTGKTGSNATPRTQPRNQRAASGSRGGSRIQMPPEALSGWEAEDEPGNQRADDDERNEFEDDGTTIAMLDEPAEFESTAANDRRRSGRTGSGRSGSERNSSGRAGNESRIEETDEPELERTADASRADGFDDDNYDDKNTGRGEAPGRRKKTVNSASRSLEIEEENSAADGKRLDLGEFKPGLLDEAYAAATGPRSKRSSGRKTATGTQLRGQSPELPRTPPRNGDKRRGRDEPLNDDEPLTFEKAQDRLRDLGLAPGDYRVLRLKESGDFRFEANLRAGETARILRRFEADAADELSAVANVIEQIEQYLDSAGL